MQNKKSHQKSRVARNQESLDLQQIAGNTRVPTGHRIYPNGERRGEDNYSGSKTGQKISEKMRERRKKKRKRKRWRERGRKKRSELTCDNTCNDDGKAAYAANLSPPKKYLRTLILLTPLSCYPCAK